MRARIAALEARARRLEPPPEARQRLDDAARSWAEGFLGRLPDAPTYRAGAPGPDDPGLALAEEGATPEDAVAALGTVLDGAGINPASGGHFGYIPGGGLYPSALADFLADVSNRYAGVAFASPAAARMERDLVRWMCGLVGLPGTAGGDLTSGGSIANLSAVVTAREAAGLEAGGVGRAVVYLTDQTHHCVDKALRVAGLAGCVRRRVAMDGRWRMDPDALDHAIATDREAGLRPWLVVASAGTTNTGAVDPLEAIADVGEAHGLWLHCDAAYGGFFLLTDTGRRMLGGMGRYHSVVMDPHKGLFLPFGSGALLVADEQVLARAHRHTADYMQDARGTDGSFSPADLSPELSRPFRGPRMWLPLKLFGLAPFRACLEEKLLLARYFHDEVGRIPGFRPGPPPELSVATFRYEPPAGDADEHNRALLRRILHDGSVFISSTVLDGRYTLRFAALHFRSHLADVDRLLGLLRRLRG